MRKQYVLGMTLIASLAFASCSKDEQVVQEGNGIEAVQVLTLQVANSGDGLTTRADRPLYSSEAKQDINKVKVVIYKVGESGDSPTISDAWGSNKTIVAVKTFDNWMNGGVSGVYNNATYGHGRQASWTLSTTDLIKEPGKYIAYAIGYNDNEYEGESWTSFTKAVKESQLTFPINATIASARNNKASEIFAGASDIFEISEKSVSDGAEGTVESYHFNTSITLHRQVAGAIGYFTNIPTKGNADHASAEGKKLRLVAAAKNSNVVFAGFNSEFKGTPVTSPDQTNAVKYVVNGTTSLTADAKFYNTAENNGANDAFTVYEISLADWFKNSTDMDTNNDGLLNELDGDWTNPISGATFAEGSVFGSSFLIPFELVKDKATFQLQMLDTNDNIIRYWNIRLNDAQVGENVTVVATGGAETSSSTAENNVNYSVVRNHIYGIGLRNDGDNPTDPGTDPDKPQDLNDETLVLRVNDNWEMIHQMEID